MKRLLMVAFHFPPMAGSSGIQRTLRFVRHLPEFGWSPIVLSAHPRAYEQTSDELIKDVPTETVVHRAFALDAARHLSLRGRYPGFLARPDRWRVWRWGAVPAGMDLIRRYKPAVIWSTYPIATAHLIGADLHRQSKLPWVADFRDPMAQDGYPTDPKTWRCFKAIEESTLHNATRSVFTTTGAARVYLDRYPDLPWKRVTSIENGYDEDSFTGLDDNRSPLDPRRLTLLHSGIIHPVDRDPTQLCDALRRLLEAGRIDPRSLLIRLRAAVHETFLRVLIERNGLADLVELAPPISYRQALSEMIRADGLLVLQASNCNAQVPAKVYEYFRAGRPILGLTDPAGDTAGVLRQAGIHAVARLDSVEEIAKVLPQFINSIQSNTASIARPESVKQGLRRYRTRELATLLDNVVG